MNTPYVELHCHSAFSFLDGASLPEELVAAAIERGHGALALTDHDNLCGAMEFAQAAKAEGLRAIHGLELTVSIPTAGPDGAGGAATAPPGTNHLTLLAENADGWRSLCRIVTEAHSATREGRPGSPVRAPVAPLDSVLDNSDGLVCLTGCAERGVQRRPNRGDPARGIRPRPVEGRAAAAVPPRRPRPQRLARAARQGTRCSMRRNGQRPRPRPFEGRPPGCVRLGQAAPVARRERAEPPWQLDPRPRRPGGDGRPLRRPSGGGGGERRTGREAAVRPDPETSATAIRARGTETPTVSWPRSALPRFDSRYADSPAGLRGEARARLDEELKVIDRTRPGRLLPAPPRPARTGPGGRGRGPRACDRPRAAAARPGPRLVGLLDRLLPDRPLPHRPGHCEALPRAVPQRGPHTAPDIDLDFPRDIRERLIPRIHERYGREHTALVAAFPTYRARGAIRDLGGALGLPAGRDRAGR